MALIECMCALSAQKSGATGKKASKKTTEEESESKDEDSDEDELAEEHPPPPATSSWSSDHNYNAVTPEKTTPISTVLNKACMYLFEGLDNPSLTMTSFRTIGHCQASKVTIICIGLCVRNYIVFYVMNVALPGQHMP